MSLGKKSFNAMIWSFTDSFGIYFIKFGFTIAIARELDPSDYGLIGMTGIFIALASIITESGFASALIQKKNCTNDDFSTVFIFNIAASVLLWFVLALLANPIASFFNEPILGQIIIISSTGIILNSLVTVQITILNKELNFRKQAIINFFAALASGCTGLFLAMRGHGVWALVYQSLAGAVLSTVLFWSTSPWKPVLRFSRSSFMELYRYGLNIFLQGLTSVILDRIYYPLIGKMFNATQLGFFSNADRFYQVFVRRITVAYGKVTFPMFSLLQDRNDEVKRVYRKTAITLAFVLIPFTAFLILSAKPVIIILLTEKWIESVPYLKLLYTDGFFFPFLLLNQNILNSLGNSRASLRIDLLKKTALLAGVFITFSFGVKALIISQVVSTAIGLIYSITVLKPYLGSERLINEIFKIALFTAIFASVAYFLSLSADSYILQVIIQVLCFIAYFMVGWLLKTEGYINLVNFVSPLFKKEGS